MVRSPLVDTDVLVVFFRDYSKAVTFINTNSSHTHSVVHSSCRIVCWRKRECRIKSVRKFYLPIPGIPVTSEIARVGGLYKGDDGKSHGVGLADAIIAATCEVENAELKTLNTKHYPVIKGA